MFEKNSLRRFQVTRCSVFFQEPISCLLAASSILTLLVHLSPAGPAGPIRSWSISQILCSNASAILFEFRQLLDTRAEVEV